MDSGRQHVAGGEHTVCFGKPLFGPAQVVAQVLGEQVFRVDVVLPAGHSRFAAGLEKALVPQVGRQVHGDYSVSEQQRRLAAVRQKLLGSQHASLVVVAGHGGHTVHGALNAHLGDVRQVGDSSQVPAAHQHPRHIVGAQGGKLLPLPVTMAAGSAEKQLIARLVAGRFHRGGQCAEKRVVDVGNDQPDQMAVLAHQGPGHLVGVVVQFLHHLEHSVLGLLAD